ncbi:NAD(P)-binding domain-containing protein, partial [Pseudomonas aeruginosa]|uniref:NAD(P)-binding domain-containing protein n=1 Tax=Pseudomonas aeruginosa TaxID=287 RepID=UPI0034E073A7
MKQIAFIGLGHMGAPMATNLLKAGYLLNVFDLVQSAVDGLVAAGAKGLGAVAAQQHAGDAGVLGPGV